jgi:hypothetical protein
MKKISPSQKCSDLKGAASIIHMMQKFSEINRINQLMTPATHNTAELISAISRLGGSLQSLWYRNDKNNKKRKHTSL